MVRFLVQCAYRVHLSADCQLSVSVSHDHALNLNISTQAIACAMYYGRE